MKKIFLILFSSLILISCNSSTENSGDNSNSSKPSLEASVTEEYFSPAQFVNFIRDERFSGNLGEISLTEIQKRGIENWLIANINSIPETSFFNISDSERIIFVGVDYNVENDRNFGNVVFLDENGDLGIPNSYLLVFREKDSSINYLGNLNLFYSKVGFKNLTNGNFVVNVSSEDENISSNVDYLYDGSGTFEEIVN